MRVGVECVCRNQEMRMLDLGQKCAAIALLVLTPLGGQWVLDAAAGTEGP